MPYFVVFHLGLHCFYLAVPGLQREKTTSLRKGVRNHVHLRDCAYAAAHLPLRLSTDTTVVPTKSDSDEIFCL